MFSGITKREFMTSEREFRCNQKLHAIKLWLHISIELEHLGNRDSNKQKTKPIGGLER